MDYVSIRVAGEIEEEACAEPERVGLVPHVALCPVLGQREAPDRLGPRVEGTLVNSQHSRQQGDVAGADVLRWRP